MLAVTGYRSRIIRILDGLVPEQVVRVNYETYRHYATEANRFVLCAGLLTPKRGIDQTAEEIVNSMQVNYLFPITMCDEIFNANSKARICIVGSESGISGSYDDVYAGAKGAIQHYVERKKLPYPEHQQLVAVAPSIIEDCAMTLRRRDQDNLNQKRLSHPKKRFLNALEVAKLIHFLLYIDEGYISGITIRMNGGAHICKV